MKAGTSQNGHTFSQLLKRAIYVPALLLISMAALLLWHLSHFNQTIRSFQIAEENIVRLGEMRAEALQLMSEVRGYLISNKLESVRNFPQRIGGILDEIRNLEEDLNDHPRKVEHLQAMSESIRTWAEFSQKTIRFNQTSGGQIASDFKEGSGKQLMTTFLTHLDSLLKDESFSVQERASQYHNYRTAFVVLVLLGAIGIALTLILFSRSQLRHLSYSFETSQWKLKTALEERRLHQEGSDFLSEASKRLSSSLNFKQNLSEIAQFSLPRLADWVVVDLVHQHNIKSTVRWSVFHRNPNKKALADKLLKLGSTHNKSLTRKALLTGEPQILPMISNEQLNTIAEKPEISELLKQLGTQSMAIYPMISRGKTLGCLTFVLGDSGRDFTENHLEICAELTRRTSAAVDNGLLYLEAQEAAQARDEFLSIASHELKTPMTALSLQLQLLVRELKSRSELSSSYQGIQLCLNQVRKLTELLDDLLDMTRIRAGQIVLNKTLVDLPELIREVVNRFKPETEALGIPVTLSGEPHLSGIWDPIRLDQCLSNLISNAIKYGNRQPVEITIAKKRTQAIITIEDHGPGIEPEFQKKIFRRFERAPSCEHLGGLGLGLYITHQLVQAHEGTIRLHSQIGRGSQFVVTLPIAELGEGSFPIQKHAV